MQESDLTKPWYVYLIRMGSGMLYTGISTEPERRLQEHKGSPKGAKSLRGKGPLTLEWQTKVANRSQASVIESRIKRMNRAEKENIIKRGIPGWELD